MSYFLLKDFTTSELISFAIPSLLIIILSLIANYKVFEKMGLNPYHGLIPIYSDLVLIERFLGSMLYALLFLIPIINIYFAIKFTYRIGKSFNYGIGWTILQLLFNPIPYMVLAFSNRVFIDHGYYKK